MSRSPFGWDLPPGVTTSMLPGNSREEMEEEAFADAVFEFLNDRVSEELALEIAEWASKLRSDAYTAGYQQANADNAMAKDYEAEKRAVELEDEPHASNAEDRRPFAEDEGK